MSDPPLSDIDFKNKMAWVCTKLGCVFPMVIRPAFRMGQYRVNDHPYHTPHFNLNRLPLSSRYVRREILPLFLKQTMILHQIVVLIYQQLLVKDFLVHYLWFVDLLQISLQLLWNIVCRQGLLVYNEHCRIRLISCNQWVNQIQVCKGQKSADGVLSDQYDPWQDLEFSCKDMVVSHCPVLFAVQYLWKYRWEYYREFPLEY